MLISLIAQLFLGTFCLLLFWTVTFGGCKSCDISCLFLINNPENSELGNIFVVFSLINLLNLTIILPTLELFLIFIQLVPLRSGAPKLRATALLVEREIGFLLGGKANRPLGAL